MRKLSLSIVAFAFSLLAYSYSAETSVFLTILPGTGDAGTGEATPPVTGTIPTGDVTALPLPPIQFAG